MLLLRKKRKNARKDLIDALEAVEVIRRAEDADELFTFMGYAFGVAYEKVQSGKLSRATGRTIMELAEAVKDARLRMLSSGVWGDSPDQDYEEEEEGEPEKAPEEEGEQ